MANRVRNDGFELGDLSYWLTSGFEATNDPTVDLHGGMVVSRPPPEGTWYARITKVAGVYPAGWLQQVLAYPLNTDLVTEVSFRVVGCRLTPPWDYVLYHYTDGSVSSVDIDGEYLEWWRLTHTVKPGKLLDYLTFIRTAAFEASLNVDSVIVESPEEAPLGPAATALPVVVALLGGVIS